MNIKDIKIRDLNRLDDEEFVFKKPVFIQI